VKSDWTTDTAAVPWSRVEAVANSDKEFRMGLRDSRGTIALVARHAQPDWPTNGREYAFGPSPEPVDGVTIAFRKLPDGSGEARVADGTETITFRAPIPPDLSDGLLVAAAWNKGTVALYLNGDKADQATLAAET
jgi:hypothetical protein